MESAVIEKTESELRKELDELNRQQRQITERLRDPRGLRRGGISGPGQRNFAASGGRQRGFVRPADRNDAEDQPPAKRRLSSAVVKLEEGEISEDVAETGKDMKKDDGAGHESNGNGNGNGIGNGNGVGNGNGSAGFNGKQTNWLRRDAYQRPSRMDFDIPTENVPRVMPKNEDPTLVSRNKRILGQLLGTLERFKKEDVQRSGSEAYMRRSDSLKMAEQKAREESERLRQQEREEIAEKRKRDLTLKARVAAKAEEKRLELLFLRWSEHQKKLGNFIRTKAEPPIYYTFAKPMDEDTNLVEERKEQVYQEWKTTRREDLSEYQKQVAERYLANVDKELERWQNMRKGRKPHNDMANLQETMDKELETHQLEHGPKTRMLPGGTNDDEDVDDINVAEDDMMDDVLVVDENGRRGDEIAKPEAINGSSPPDNVEQ